MLMTGKINRIEAKIFNKSPSSKKLDMTPKNGYMALALFEQQLVKSSKFKAIIETGSTKSVIQMFEHCPSIKKEKPKRDKALPPMNKIPVETFQIPEPEPQPQPQKDPPKKYTFISNNSSHIKVPPTCNCLFYI